jgi:hypothetical protein
MVGPSKKQKHLSDEKLSELLHNPEPSVILESKFCDDGDMMWTCHQVVNKEQILMMKMTTVKCKMILGLG